MHQSLRYFESSIAVFIMNKTLLTITFLITVLFYLLVMLPTLKTYLVSRYVRIKLISVFCAMLVLTECAYNIEGTRFNIIYERSNIISPRKSQLI